MERQKVSDAPIFMSKSDFFAPKSDFGPPGGSQGGRFFLDSGQFFQIFSIFVHLNSKRTGSARAPSASATLRAAITVHVSVMSRALRAAARAFGAQSGKKKEGLLCSL